MKPVAQFNKQGLRILLEFIHKMSRGEPASTGDFLKVLDDDDKDDDEADRIAAAWMDEYHRRNFKAELEEDEDPDEYYRPIGGGPIEEFDNLRPIVNLDKKRKTRPKAKRKPRTPARGKSKFYEDAQWIVHELELADEPMRLKDLIKGTESVINWGSPKGYTDRLKRIMKYEPRIINTTFGMYGLTAKDDDNNDDA